jgi:hypothetical protein
MAGARFGGDSCVGDAECAVFEHAGSEEGRKRTGHLCIFGLWIYRLGVGEGLKRLVCAKTVS